MAAVALLAAALPVPAPAAPRRQPTLEGRLLDAFQRRDPVELERAARRLGIGRMRAALGSARALRAAALAAAPLVPKGWLLLTTLLPLCADRDRQVALAAAEAALRIAEDLRQPELQLNEDLPETLVPAGRQLVKVVSDRQVSLDVRVKSAQALAQLLEIVTLPPGLLLPLLADPEPAVRRSATELFVHSSSDAARGRLARLVASDKPVVARAAGAVLCAEVPLARRVAAPSLTALKDAGAQPRLRELFEDSETALDELLDIARCLTRLGTPADRKALRAVQARSPSLSEKLQSLKD